MAVLSTALLMIITAPSCGGADCADSGMCSASPAHADAGAGDSTIAPPGCDLTKLPKDSPECITDTVGVFVSPTGKDGAAGTKADPLRSIAEAVTRGFPRVYVCEGTYDAPVTIAQPVAIFGGFTCAWAPADVKAKLAPSKGIALKITKVSGAVRIEDLDVLGSADASTLGDSAIAAFVSESADVTFKNATLTAGAGTEGAKGANGTSRSNYTGATATVGGSASGSTAGEGPTCTCVDGTSSKGGKGAAGNGSSLATAGTSSPAVDAPNLNDGSTSSSICSDGTVGANGGPGAAGQPSSAAGRLTASGWSAAPAPTPAANGKPAQGGGGGGAKTGVTAAGGGGGCGGCGGAGGDPGTSGGSSFALLSFQSTVTIEGGVLTSGAAGPGGEGGDGQGGQGGGGAGAGAGCAGGAGGAGAGGSGGGGGAGGHSVPIGFVGTEPKVSGATLKPGAKGGAGPGGKAGLGLGNTGNTGTPGPEGKTQNTLAL